MAFGCRLGRSPGQSFYYEHACCRCFAILQSIVKDPSQDLQARLTSGTSSIRDSSNGSIAGSNSSSVWEGLLHIVGAINYGGRVTDPEDRRLLGAILQQHLTPDVLTGSISLGRPGKRGLGDSSTHA
jgi:hypothetical protein